MKNFSILWILAVVLLTALSFADVKDPATIKTDATADLATNTEMFLQPTIDIIDSINIKYANHTAMEAGGTSMPNGTTVYLLGHGTTNDGGEGTFVLDTSASVVAAENDGTIFASAGGTDWYWRRPLPDNTITPQMFGFVDDFDGSTGTNASTVVQAAADACNVLNTSTTIFPTLNLPASQGYYCTSTITVKEGIHILMDAPIVHDLNESSMGLVVGTTAITNANVKLKLRVTRKSGDTSDWTNEGSIGIKLFNLYSSDASIVVGELAGGFTIGLQCMGSGANGFAYNNVRLGRLLNNKIGIDLTNETSGTISFTNENLFIGGNIQVNSGLRPGITRHAVRFTSADGTNTSVNQNVFQKPSIEGRSECIPFLIVHGQRNQVHDARDEGNGSVFAKILHFGARANDANKFDIGFGSGTLLQQGNAYNNTITHRKDASSFSPTRLVFDSGDIHDRAVAYDGTKTHIPDVHMGVSTNSDGKISATSVPFYVSETFTTDFATDNDKLLDTAHTLENSDRVYLTHSVDPHDLPSGLETDSGTIKQLYYVVEKATNDFKVSLTLNGSAVTFSDDGTGTHTYNARSRYVEFSTARSVGIRVDTTVAKSFVLERDTVVDFEGRVLVHCFDADNVLLQNQEDFTAVDTVNEEIISANHTLIVSDRITFTTSGGDLPDPLATSTDYWVESINVSASGRFTVSATDGGSAINLTDSGSGTHIHHLSYPYAVSGSFLWNTSYLGMYRQSSDFSTDLPFLLRSEVKSINLSLSGGTAVLRLRRFKLFTTDISSAPRTWLDYDAEGEPHKMYGTQAPTVGVYFLPLTVWNYTVANGSTPGWVLTTSGAPGTWSPMAEVPLSGSVTYDPASLVDQAGETTSLTVTGAALGDFVQVSAPYDLQDITVTGYVQAADTVEIRVQNESTNTVDLASGTWRVKVTSP